MSKINTCKKCGAQVTKHQAFCGICGAKTADRKSGKKGIIIIIAVAVFFAILGVFYSLNAESELNEYSFQAQANIANWGYIVNNGEDIYHSDGSTGIYKYKASGSKEMLIAGSFSDMALLDNTIYCIEETTFKDGSYITEVVGINIENGNKQVFYAPRVDQPYMYGISVIDGKYYFVINDNLLLYVDKNGKVENTRIYYPKHITPYGIYTSDTSEYGLALVSLKGQIIKSYQQLSKYIPYIFFELDNCIYLKDDSNRIHCLSKETGELSMFPNKELFENETSFSSINYFNEKFYILISSCDEKGNVSHNIYTTDSNGNNVEKIYQASNTTGVPFCTLNIANGYLFINYPSTSLEPKIIDLNNDYAVLLT